MTAAARLRHLRHEDTDPPARFRVSPEDLVLDRAVEEIEREIGHLGAVERVAVANIVERACRDWPDGSFW
jgi:hypothetical protein